MKAAVATLAQAEQVRLDTPRARVHHIAGVWFDPGHGYVYQTDCERELHAADGAMRTTRETSCPDCLEMTA